MSRRAKLLRLVAATMASTALVALVGGCGGGDPADNGRPAPEASEFPEAGGRSLEQIVSEAQPDKNLVVAPTQQAFEAGRNRFGFGVFNVAQKPVTDAQVALYVAPAKGGTARGPFPARIENLATAAAFRSQTVASDPDAATVAYVSDVEFPDEGNWNVAALVRDGGALRSVLLPSVRVGGFEDIPAVGDRAPRIHTPTVDSVGGDIAEIDTRTPHDDMHDVDLDEALGHKPVVLLFATPALCQTRVCGPVVDEAVEAKAKYGDDVDFIHMEVYNNNNASDGIRPQLKAYGLRTEPWLFVIDENGVIKTRIEGAFGVDELDSAIQKVIPAGGSA
jgi:hypothetical protein